MTRTHFMPVMPELGRRFPSRLSHAATSSHRCFNPNIDTSRQIDAVEGINGAASGTNDIDHPFVRSDFELFPRVFVNMGAP